MSVVFTERLLTCPYCRKNVMPKKEEKENEIRLRCPKCKLTIQVEKKKGNVEVI